MSNNSSPVERSGSFVAHSSTSTGGSEWPVRLKSSDAYQYSACGLPGAWTTAPGGTGRPRKRPISPQINSLGRQYGTAWGSLYLAIALTESRQLSDTPDPRGR